LFTGKNLLKEPSTFLFIDVKSAFLNNSKHIGHSRFLRANHHYASKSNAEDSVAVPQLVAPETWQFQNNPITTLGVFPNFRKDMTPGNPHSGSQGHSL
jgi:hypothetical protein